MRVTYRVLPRKDSPTCDVQVTEDGGKSRVVNTFNREADAWQWVSGAGTHQRDLRAYPERCPRQTLSALQFRTGPDER